MALFLSGELIPVLAFVCKREADRIFVARAMGQNTLVFLSLCSTIPPSVGSEEGIFGI